MNAPLENLERSDEHDGEARLRALVSAMDDAFCVIRLVYEGDAVVDYLFLEANTAFEAQTGLRAPVGHTIRGLVPDIDTSWFRIYGAVAATGEPVRMENHDPALARLFDLNAHRVGVGEVAVLFKDITARRKHETEREAFLAAERAARHEAEDARNRLLEVLESTQDSFFALDKDWCILQVNQNQERTTGVSRADSIGKRYWDVFPVDRDSKYWIEYHRAATERISVQFEEYYAPLDLWTEVSVFPTPHNGGIAVFYRDVSLRHRLEEERESTVARERAARLAAEAARAQSESANRMKDEFLSTVSHELRTPLNAMLGWAAMLQRGDLDEATRIRALATIERNARTQARLIEDLLDLSRVLQGKFTLAVAPVELVRLVQAALDSVRPAAEAKGVRIQPVLDSHATIVGDAERLQQIAWNLLSNAIKFTPKGGRVQVTLRRAPSFVELVVSDTGVGISADFVPHVFEPFRQADGTITRRVGGLGLGLSIVRSLVEMHGGTVTVASDGEGKGAMFAVRLPMAPLRAEPVAPGSKSAIASADDRPTFECPPELAGLRVLVVDDEKDTRELLSFVLGQCDAQVTTAASAEEAFAHVVTGEFDVLVSDIGMPGEDGLSFIRRVREQPRSSGGRIPAIALTAYARIEDRAQALRAGFNMHVTKPLDANELPLVIAALMPKD